MFFLSMEIGLDIFSSSKKNMFLDLDLKSLWGMYPVPVKNPAKVWDGK